MPVIKCPKCQNTFDFSKYEFEVASELSCSDEIEKECPFCEYIIKIKRKKKEQSEEETSQQTFPQQTDEQSLSLKRSTLQVHGRNSNGELDLQLDRSGELSFIQKTKIYIFGDIKSNRPIPFFKEIAVISSLTLFSIFLLVIYKIDFTTLRTSIYDFLISISG